VSTSWAVWRDKSLAPGGGRTARTWATIDWRRPIGPGNVIQVDTHCVGAFTSHPRIVHAGDAGQASEVRGESSALGWRTCHGVRNVTRSSTAVGFPGSRGQRGCHERGAALVGNTDASVPPKSL